MEVRGGCGYIEEWISPRLVRDAHLGSIWEGTSNIVALDVLRAARKLEAHRVLTRTLSAQLTEAQAIPQDLRAELEDRLERAARLVETARDGNEGGERLARQAASALYNAATAAILAVEGAALAERLGDARRLVLSRLVVDHRLTARDPLTPDLPEQDEAAAALLLGGQPCSLAEAQAVCGLG